MEKFFLQCTTKIQWISWDSIVPSSQPPQGNQRSTCTFTDVHTASSKISSVLYSEYCTGLQICNSATALDYATTLHCQNIWGNKQLIQILLNLNLLNVEFAGKELLRLHQTGVSSDLKFITETELSFFFCWLTDMLFTLTDKYRYAVTIFYCNMMFPR